MPLLLVVHLTALSAEETTLPAPHVLMKRQQLFLCGHVDRVCRTTLCDSSLFADNRRDVVVSHGHRHVHNDMEMSLSASCACWASIKTLSCMCSSRTQGRPRLLLTLAQWRRERGIPHSHQVPRWGSGETETPVR